MDIFDTVDTQDIFDAVPSADVFDQVDRTLWEKTKQGTKEFVASIARGGQGILGGFGGLLEMAGERLTYERNIEAFAKLSKKFSTVPGADIYAEHAIRKYGPEKAMRYMDKHATEVAKFGSRINDFWIEQANKGWEAPNPEITEARWRDRPFSKGASAIGAGVPSVAAAIAATAVTKSPHAGLAILATTETGDMYHRLRDADVDVKTAATIAQMAGAVTYVTEKIPLDELFKPGLVRSLKGALKQGSLEAMQEAVEGIGHNMLEYFGYDYRSPEDIPTAVKSAVDHALDGIMSNIVGGFGIGAMSHAVMGRPGREDQAQKMAEEMKTIEVRPPTSAELSGGINITNTEDFIDFIDTTPSRPDVIPLPQEIQESFDDLTQMEKDIAAQAEQFMKEGMDVDKAWQWARNMVETVDPPKTATVPVEVPNPVRRKLLHIKKTRPKIQRTIRQEVELLMKEGMTEEQAIQLLNDLRKEGATFEAITKPGEVTEMLKEAQDRYEKDEFAPGQIHDHEQKEFAQPGWISWITAKWRVLRNIGAEYITLPIEARFFKMQLEQIRFHSMVDKVIKSLNKQATLGDRIASRIFNRNTQPVDKIVDMLDTYEWSPEWMSKKDADLFNQLRSYTKWLLNAANIERKKAGLPLINDLKSYIPHWRENIADMIVKKTVPFQTGFIYRMLQGLPKTIKNPTAMRRTIDDKLNEYYSRNLGKLLKAIATYDLRDMYLTRPIQAAHDELLNLAKEGKIDKDTANYIDDWLNYDILKQKTRFDRAFNRSLNTPIALINKLLKPLGREITDPAEATFGSVRQLMHLGALGLRFRPVTRNLGQRLLNMSFFRARDLLKAQFGQSPVIEHPETGEPVKVLDLVREQDWYQLTKGLPEDVDITSESIRNKIMRYSMAPFRLSHVGNRYLSNVEVSALTGFHDWQYRYTKSHDTNSRYYKHIEKYSKKHGIPIEELQTQKEDMLPDIRDAVRMTQWEYMSTSMPTIIRGQAGRFAAIYQSWWMNWWTNHTAEGIHRLVTGRTKKRGDGTGGRLLSPYARLRAAKGLSVVTGLGRIAESTVGIIALSSLVMPGPTGLPPGLAFILGVAGALTEKDEKRRKKHWDKAKQSLKLILPFRNFMKDFTRFMEGEYDLFDFLFYVEKHDE